MSSPSNAVAKPLGFFDMPAEMRNKIYAACLTYGYIDIARRFNPYESHALFRVHPIITQEFGDIYYSENVFVFDARVDFRGHGYNVVQSVWKPWIEGLSERDVSNIRNIRVGTPIFTAAISIPFGRQVSVVFKLNNGFLTHTTRSEAAKLIDAFWKKLGRLNARLKGDRPAASDLDYLVKAIMVTVPFCCKSAAGSGHFSNLDLKCKGDQPFDSGLTKYFYSSFCEGCRRNTAAAGGKPVYGNITSGNAASTAQAQPITNTNTPVQSRQPERRARSSIWPRIPRPSLFGKRRSKNQRL